MPTEHAITHNPGHHRFELTIDDKLSLVAYFQPDEHTLALTHAEVHPIWKARE